MPCQPAKSARNPRSTKRKPSTTKGKLARKSPAKKKKVEDIPIKTLDVLIGMTLAQAKVRCAQEYEVTRQRVKDEMKPDNVKYKLARGFSYYPKYGGGYWWSRLRSFCGPGSTKAFKTKIVKQNVQNWNIFAKKHGLCTFTVAEVLKDMS